MDRKLFAWRLFFYFRRRRFACSSNSLLKMEIL
jgi:hypothetical protein